ncbi:MAG: hypothetical protein ABFE16_18520 [Armatimonadia bacterium]
MLPSEASQVTDEMMAAVERCAPAVVAAMARGSDCLAAGTDRESLVGQLLLKVAERACSEHWPAEGYERRAETLTLEYLGADLQDGLGALGSVRLVGVQPTPQMRSRVLSVLEELDTLRLQVLALLLQEELSLAETAQVLGIAPEQVREECLRVLEQICEIVGAAEDRR